MSRYTELLHWMEVAEEALGKACEQTSEQGRVRRALEEARYLVADQKLAVQRLQRLRQEEDK